MLCNSKHVLTICIKRYHFSKRNSRDDAGLCPQKLLAEIYVVGFICSYI